MTRGRVAVAIGMAMLMMGSLAACGGGGGTEGGPVVTTSGGPAGATASLIWDPVVDPNVQGYNIYYGTQSRSYSGSVNAGANNSYTVANLERAMTYYFAVTAYNFSGLESGYSGEVNITTP